MSETLQQTKVKTMRKYSCKLKRNNFGSVNEDLESSLFIEISYHPDGRMEQELRYNKEGEVEERHEYIYDSGNKLILHNWSMPLDEIEQSEKTERDDKGRITREVKMYYGEEGDYSVYKYDEKDNPVSVEIYDEEGNKMHEELLTYNDAGKVVTKKTIDHAGNKTAEYSYSYDASGNLAEQVEKNEDGVLQSKTVFEKDEKGNDLSIVQYNSAGEITQRMNNTYDENGRVIQRVSSGFYTRIFTYQYDDAGNLVDETAADENGNVISRNSFEYDVSNHLVHETIYEMDLTHSGRDTALIYRYEYDLTEG